MAKSKSASAKNNAHRSVCPIACTLDLVGDKWTLLIIRDMKFFRKTRFEEFLESPENISTNILAHRLKKLENNGIITKTQYGSHSKRMCYSLTERGEYLSEVLRGFVQWGLKSFADTTTEIKEQKDADVEEQI